ncbi:hypothetical protein ACSLBF_04565 [Pseudoalteromonas sp. T1lg65]|uniref:hypothetical protein n=1 Tax=Pseudoalteromonas sp. T1lg65 TaxID=2077101 RepID=UPI003F7B090C
MKYWRAILIVLLSAAIASFIWAFWSIVWEQGTSSVDLSNTMPHKNDNTVKHTELAELNFEPSTPVINPIDSIAITDPEYLPPINQNKQQTEGYQGDLDDHENYQRYQASKEVALKQAYIEAVDGKVEKLEALLKKGIEARLPETQLQEARDKIAGLREMQKQLQNELDNK